MDRFASQLRARSVAHPLVSIPVITLLALVLALAPLQVALGFGGLVVAAALAVLGPIWGVYLVLLSVPIQQQIVLPGGTSFTQAAVLLMAAAWALRLIAQPHRPIVSGRLFWCWLALLGALLLATSLTPYDRAESLKATLRWVVAFLVWFVAVNATTRRWQLVGLVACLLAAPTAEALVGLYQFLVGTGPPSFRIATSLPFVRAYGTIGQPNSFAGYMNMAWPLALALAIGVTLVYARRGQESAERRAQSAERRVQSAERTNKRLVAIGLVGAVLLWMMAGALLLALGASFSLGGWVGALVGCLGLSICLGRRWALLALGSALVLVAFSVLGGVNLLPSAISGRVTRLTGLLSFFDPATVTVTPENFALVERMAQMKAGALMFLAHPLVGVGPGAYSLAYGDVASAPWYASRGHAHNFYLHMAAETGTLGLAAYLLLIGGALGQALRALRQADTIVARSTIVGCCGIIAAVAGHNLFENLHVLNFGVQLSGVWALATVLPHIRAASDAPHAAQNDSDPHTRF